MNAFSYSFFGTNTETNDFADPAAGTMRSRKCNSSVWRSSLSVLTRGLLLIRQAEVDQSGGNYVKCLISHCNQTSHNVKLHHSNLEYTNNSYPLHFRKPRHGKNEYYSGQMLQ